MEQEILIALKKQRRLTALIAVMIAVIMAAVLACSAVVVPKALRLMDEAEGTLTAANQVVSDLSQVTEELKGADLAGLVENTDKLVSQSSEGIEQALQQLNEVDFKTLNGAIHSLYSVVQPLAAFFGR